MRKIVLTALCLTLTISFSGNNFLSALDTSLTLEFESGYTTGEAKEYVYYYLPLNYLNGQYTDMFGMLSRLDYPLDAPVESLDFRFRFWNFILGANVLVSVPGIKSSMEDRDWSWIAADPANLKDGRTGVTGYSEHESALDHGFDFIGSLSYAIDFSFPLSIIPSAGIAYKKLKWTARDGYGRYSYSYDKDKIPPYTVTNFVGPVIVYSQTYFLPFVGLSLSYTLFDLFEITAGGRYYPYMIIQGIDDHILRKITFKDVMNGSEDALGASGSLEIWFKPKQLNNWAFGLKGTAEYLQSTFGEEYTRDEGKGEYALQNGVQSRAVNYSFAVYLGVKYKFQFGGK